MLYPAYLGGEEGGTLIYMASPRQVLCQSGFDGTICEYIDMIQTAVMCHRTSEKQTNTRTKSLNQHTIHISKDGSA